MWAGGFAKADLQKRNGCSNSIWLAASKPIDVVIRTFFSLKIKVQVQESIW